MTTTQENYPEETRAREELLHGVPMLSPRPTGKHILIASRLGGILSSLFDRGHGGPGGWWILSEPEILMPSSKCIPDIAGWRRERMPQIPNGYLFEVCPNWVCEVISDGSDGEITDERLSEALCEARPRFTHSLSRSDCLVNSRKTDRKVKPPIYLKGGVSYLWLIEPESRTLEVLESTPNGWLAVQSFSDDEVVRAKPFDAVEIDLFEVWGDEQKKI
jgi:Uma2 family endonuclease